MNSLLVSLFRSVFGLITWAGITGCIILGGVGVLQSNAEMNLAGWGILILGPIFIIITSGVIALMIQNNDYLRQIAEQRSTDHRTGEKPKPEYPEVTAGRREPQVR